MLKEQLSRCKMFFNKLAAYPVWQETPPDFVANDLLVSDIIMRFRALKVA